LAEAYSQIKAQREDINRLLAAQSDTAKLRDLAQRLARMLEESSIGFLAGTSSSAHAYAKRADLLAEARAAGLLSVPLEGK
jgi:hypothetical protein